MAVGDAARVADVDSLREEDGVVDDEEVKLLTIYLSTSSSKCNDMFFMSREETRLPLETKILRKAQRLFALFEKQINQVTHSSFYKTEECSAVTILSRQQGA